MRPMNSFPDSVMDSRASSDSTASHSGPQKRSRNAVRRSQLRISGVRFARTSSNRYSRTECISLGMLSAKSSVEPDSGTASAARRSATGHPSVRSCSLSIAFSEILSPRMRRTISLDSTEVKVSWAMRISVSKARARKLWKSSGGSRLVMMARCRFLGGCLSTRFMKSCTAEAERL